MTMPELFLEVWKDLGKIGNKKIRRRIYGSTNPLWIRLKAIRAREQTRNQKEENTRFFVWVLQLPGQAPNPETTISLPSARFPGVSNSWKLSQPHRLFEVQVRWWYLADFSRETVYRLFEKYDSLRQRSPNPAIRHSLLIVFFQRHKIFCIRNQQIPRYFSDG